MDIIPKKAYLPRSRLCSVLSYPQFEMDLPLLSFSTHPGQALSLTPVVTAALLLTRDQSPNLETPRCRCQ